MPQNCQRSPFSFGLFSGFSQIKPAVESAFTAAFCLRTVTVFCGYPLPLSPFWLLWTLFFLLHCDLKLGFFFPFYLNNPGFFPLKASFFRPSLLDRGSGLGLGLKKGLIVRHGIELRMFRKKYYKALYKKTCTHREHANSTQQSPQNMRQPRVRPVINRRSPVPLYQSHPVGCDW